MFCFRCDCQWQLETNIGKTLSVTSARSIRSQGRALSAHGPASFFVVSGLASEMDRTAPVGGRFQSDGNASSVAVWQTQMPKYMDAQGAWELALPLPAPQSAQALKPSRAAWNDAAQTPETLLAGECQVRGKHLCR